MYWMETSFPWNKIEAAYLNGTGRRVILHEYSLYTAYAAIALHASNIYFAFSDGRTNSYGYFLLHLKLPVAEGIQELLMGYHPSLFFLRGELCLV